MPRLESGWRLHAAGGRAVCGRLVLCCLSSPRCAGLACGMVDGERRYYEKVYWNEGGRLGGWVSWCVRRMDPAASQSQSETDGTWLGDGGWQHAVTPVMTCFFLFSTSSHRRCHDTVTPAWLVVICVLLFVVLLCMCMCIQPTRVACMYGWREMGVSGLLACMCTIS